MPEEPIRDQARSDKSASSYRMTSFLVLSSRTQPVSEEEIPDEKGGLAPPVAVEEPPAADQSAFTIQAETSVPPLTLLWQHTQALYRILVLVLTYPLVLAQRWLNRLGQTIYLLGYVLTEVLVRQPLRRIRAGSSTLSNALWFHLTGLRWDRSPSLPPKTRGTDVPVEVELESPVSLLDLHQINIDFTDNRNRPIYDFQASRRSRYHLSKAIVDPIATRNALAAIRECSGRAASIPPPMDGRYAGIPVAEVLAEVGEYDLQAFLRYVKAYPGNYIGRNLKMSETFATWVVYGAPEP